MMGKPNTKIGYICKKCNYEWVDWLLDVSILCPNCGTHDNVIYKKLSTSSGIHPTCEYCGRTNLDKSECCNGCGAPLQYNVVPERENLPARAINPHKEHPYSYVLQQAFPYQYHETLRYIGGGGGGKTSGKY